MQAEPVPLPPSPPRILRALLLSGAAACLFAAGASAADSAGPLLWPLPILEGCPSIFGESRGNHLHGGVDFRTHKEEGWPVFASADGAVERIRREISGYGRVLYLKLDDGRTVVYGHLCRFEDAELGMESRLRAECSRAKTSFPGDIWFHPPLRVRAGQVVAYSGQLGIGSPHLHMEVRDGDVQLDPFAQGLPLPVGLEAPRILGLTFVPRDAASLVQDSFLPVRLKASPLFDGTYALDEPVRLSGLVDVALVADDSYGTEDIRCGISAASATLDGTGFFRADLRRFDLKETFQGPALWLAGLGWDGAEALLLRKDASLTLSGVEGSGLPAIEGQPEGILQVTARNHGASSSTVSALLLPSDAPLPTRGDLPGRDFRLLSHRFLPAGLLVELKRRGVGGGTSLTLGGRVVEGLMVREEEDDIVRVLIPLASIPSEAGQLAAGGEDLGLLAASGPAELACGGLRLRVPRGAVAAASDGKGENPSATFGVFPPSLRSKASVLFPPGGQRGTWAQGAGGRFLGAGGGKQAYRGDGTYALRVDRTPPTWGKPFRATIPHIEAREIRVPLKDSGCGPDLATLRVRLDGKPAYPDWDSDAGLLRFDASRLKPGRHTLEGSVRDRAGNRSTLKKRAVVIPRK